MIISIGWCAIMNIRNLILMANYVAEGIASISAEVGAVVGAVPVTVYPVQQIPNAQSLGQGIFKTLH